MSLGAVSALISHEFAIPVLLKRVICAKQLMSAPQQEVHIVIVYNEPTRVYPAVTEALGATAIGSKVML